MTIAGLKWYIKNPKALFSKLASMNFFGWLSDSAFLKLKWFVQCGKILNLNSPQGFNEKLQWLKLNDKREEYTIFADKYLAKEAVAKIIGEEHVIPLIGVWDKPEDIVFEDLPKSFVIKCSHNSGEGLFVCKDKDSLNIEEVKQALNKALKKNYFCDSREWSYKMIKPRIICEKLVKDDCSNNSTLSLVNYNFYCFNGEPKFLYIRVDDVSSGKKGEPMLTFLDLNWEKPEFYREDHKQIPIQVECPSDFENMIKIARKLAQDFPFVRVDLYHADNKILFSEMTFYPGGGYGFFKPKKWENELGSWIKLPYEN